MADVKEAEGVTGYVAGGISPLGQRKRLRTFIDESAFSYDEMFLNSKNNKKGTKFRFEERRQRLISFRFEQNRKTCFYRFDLFRETQIPFFRFASTVSRNPAFRFVSNTKTPFRTTIMLFLFADE